MPGMTGLSFIEIQKEKGCKVPHIAVMSATWSESQYQRAVTWDAKYLKNHLG